MLDLTIEARIDANDSSPLELGGAKQQRVLAALLLAKGSVVSNDRLIDTVWGDHPPAKPHVTLRSYVSHLRRLLEPERDAGERARRIVTRAPGYAIELDATELDAWQFEIEVAEANSALGAGAYEAALDTARTALSRWAVDDLSAGVLEPFDAEVRRLEELRRLARRIVHESLLASGRHDEALPSLEAALRLDPFDEGIRAQLMLALYRSGRQADALAAYRSGQDLLLEELGLDTSPELRSLEARILRNDPDLDWSAPTQRERSLRRAVEQFRDEPPPAGRSQESAALLRQLDEATTNSGGGVIIVTGEPGIGKSTVLRHGMDGAMGRGMAVALGRCHEGSMDTTLFPWIAAWRALVERLTDDELEFVVGNTARWLSQILPEIGERLGIEPEPSTDRYTLFDAVVRTLRHGSTIQPVCIVLEDLHWADENSLRLLAMIAESLIDVPVVVLVSWRDTEPVSAEVSALLADLAGKATVRIHLEGLGPDAVAAIVSQELGAVANSGSAGFGVDVRRLASRTGGNPLFIGELLRSRQLTGQMASSNTVREVINGRLGRLPTGTSDSLAVGALCLDGFSETMIAKVLGVDDEAVLDQLEAALAARMIEEDPAHGDRFRFTHDLFAETLLAQLSAPRRARFHTKLGLALETERSGLSELAHHFLNGVGDEAALKGGEYAHQAAVAAVALFDYEGALRLLEAGVAGVERIDDDALLARLLLELIQVKKHTAQPVDVHEVAERAFAVARRVSDVRLMARVAVAFEGSSGLTENDNDPTWLGYWCPPGVIIPMIEQCLEKLPSDDPYVPVLWAALGFQFFGEFEDIPASDHATAKAIEAARAHHRPAQLSLALHQRHDALQRVLGVNERTALLDESLANADPERHPLQTVAVHRARAVLALDRCDLVQAWRELAEARMLAEACGRESAMMNVEVGEVAILLMQGHLDEAQARLDEAFVRYERFGDVMLDQFGLQLSSLWREQHRHAEVLELLEFKQSGYPGPAFSAPAAALLSEMGRTDEAAALTASFTPQEQTSGGEPILQFLTPSWFAEVAADLGDVVLAERMLPVMLAARRRVVSVYDGILLLGSGSHFAARLHLAMDNLDDAEALLGEASDQHKAIDCHPGLARDALVRADLGVLRGDGSAVAEALTDAEQWSQRSGQRWRIDRWIAANPGWV